MISLIPCNSFAILRRWYVGGTSEWLWFSKNIGVKVCDSRSMRVWSVVMRWSWSMIYYWLFSLCVAVGGARWLTPTNLPPRGMHSSTLLRGLIDFCNKYVSSLWLMRVHGLYALSPFRNLLASPVPCIALSHLESWCKLRRCIQTPWYDMLYHT
jgi:hypothetical protein